ncbi:MAG TPA: hypothetical protein VGH28_14640 [Polyangiaceae bacterium]
MGRLWIARCALVALAFVQCREEQPSAAPQSAASASALPSPPPAPTASAVAVDRASLPCGDALLGADASPGEIDDLSMSHMTGDRVFVSATSFAAKRTVAYVVAPGGATRVGTIGTMPSRTIAGHGDVVVAEAHRTTLCKAGASVQIPADPQGRGDWLVTSFVDDHTLVSVYAETISHGPPCRRLTGGTRVVKRIFVDAVDLDAPQPTWKTVSSHAVPAPSGAACRSSIPIAAAATADRALVVLESCVQIDAGDSISSQHCSLAAERLATGTWERFAMPGERQDFVTPVAARDGERVAFETAQASGAFVVYRLEHGAFVAEGPARDGDPLAIEGTHLLRIDARGTHPGPSGLGFRVFADELAGGAWRSASDALETTSRAWAFDTSGPAPFAAVADEHATSFRVATVRAGRWVVEATVP